MPDNSSTRGVVSSIFSGMFTLGCVVVSNLVKLNKVFSVAYIVGQTSGRIHF